MPVTVPQHFVHVMKETCRRRRKRVSILLHINILFEWAETLFPSVYKSKCGEVIEDHLVDPSNSLLANLTRIISREFNGVVFMIVGGAYDSAARTLRWILETVLKAFVAIDDKSILTRSPADKGQAMTFDEFIDFLEYTDLETKRRKNKQLLNWLDDTEFVKRARRWKIIRGIDRLPTKINLRWLGGLENAENKGADLIYYAYEQLSGYIHTNLRDFRLSSPDVCPFVSYEPEEFDKVYRLAILTSDIVIYLLILGMWMDIGHYCEGAGASFQEVIVRELGTEKLSYFLKELPSLKRLVMVGRKNAYLILQGRYQLLRETPTTKIGNSIILKQHIRNTNFSEYMNNIIENLNIARRKRDKVLCVHCS